MTEPPPSPGFPYLTVAATLATLFLFFGLMIVAYRSPNYLGEPKSEPKADADAKLNAVSARNQAVLDGKDSGVAMSANEATEKLVAAAEKSKSEAHTYGVLPFPVEPKVPEKKDAK